MTLLLAYEHEKWQHDMKRVHSLDSLVQFLFNGKNIEHMQCLIKDNVCIYKEYSSDHSMDKIEKWQEKLSLRLKYINKEVDTIDINNNNNELLLPEDVLLYFPSAFTAMECKNLKVVSLSVQEGKLHEAMAYDAIISLHNVVKDVMVAKKNNWTYVFEIAIEDSMGTQDSKCKCCAWLTLDDDESESKQPADDVLRYAEATRQKQAIYTKIKAIAKVQLKVINYGLRHMVQRILNEACEVFKQVILNTSEIETWM
ncbi:hypothetical protein ARMGADRAFT_1023270 [Armillaria gallica]|uniref:Uncharacterized protein n=1 Tax=Armillaria gallica TaxID=47427 RepID=A0A2H3EQ38_ARMGA|nr:hypothetical protein ARMGADRAFT_1023270 [Armillaria gallica]